MTTALYRRYRPETFRDVIGQEHVTEPLMQALRTGRVNHAYLFSGPRGCGKTTSARILARCLNCEQGPTPEPCGVCDSCAALARGGPGTVDVIEIDAASHGGVDDARDLRERASYGPAQSRFKVYIIDEAHMVTPQGFNALLKIVEEPPEHVKFVFATTEPDKVIGTIRSRTHHYPFRLVPPARLTAYMEQLCEQEGVTVAPGVLGFVTRAGGGSVRDSLSVLDQLIAGSGAEGLTYEGAAALLGFTDGELLDATIDALAAGDGATVFSQIDKVIESGHDPRRFVEDLLERLRDLIIVAAVPDGAGSVLRGVPEDQLERMRGQQARFGPGALSRAADIVNTGLTEMTGATAPRMQLELICARILLPAASGSSGYAARLDRLERRLELGGTPSANRPNGGGVSPSAPTDRGGPLAGSSAGPSNGTASQRRLEPRQEPRPEPAGERDDPSGTVEHRGAGRPVTEQPQQRNHAATAPTSAGGPRETVASATAPAAGSPGDAGSVDSPEVGQDTAASGIHPAGGVDTAGGLDTAARSLDTAAGSLEGAEGGQKTAAGGIDTAAIRRVWPDVLARVFTMRRVTWTFLSQHAQVIEYDGSRLVLGIATVGLTNTFRQGNHAELVRQALIDEIGVDVLVEGRPASEGGSSSPPGPGAPAQPTGPGAPSPQGAPRGGGWSGNHGVPEPPEPDPGWYDDETGAAPAPAATRRAADPSAQRSSGGARGGSAGSAGSSAGAPGRPPGSPRPSASQREPASTGAATAMPASGTRIRPDSAHTAVIASSRDDGVSDDDEDITPPGAGGRAVIERVLGGQFIGEIEE